MATHSFKAQMLSMQIWFESLAHWREETSKSLLITYVHSLVHCRHLCLHLRTVLFATPASACDKAAWL